MTKDEMIEEQDKKITALIIFILSLCQKEGRESDMEAAHKLFEEIGV